MNFSRFVCAIVLVLVGTGCSIINQEVATHGVLLPSGAVTPVPVVPGCPTFGPRIVFTNVSDPDLSEERSTLEANFMRPVSISATADPETGEPLFDIIAVEDQFGAPPGWGMSTGLSRADVISTVTTVPGRRLSSIDAYLGEGNTRLYAITWVDDPLTAEFSIGVTLAQLRDDEDMNRAAGRRPIWVDGFHNGENTRFSAIWVNDGVTSEMDLDTLDFDAAEAAWEVRTDQGMRMLRMTQFEVNVDGDSEATETRRMSVWQTDNSSCAGSHWATFTADGPVTVQSTLAAQIERVNYHAISNGEITVDLDDLPGLLSVGPGEGPGGGELRNINPQGNPPDGTIAVLRILRPHLPFTIVDTHFPTFEPENPPAGLDELLDGNIRLQRWNEGSGVTDEAVNNDETCVTNALLSGCSGQSMQLAEFYNRISLAWDAEEEVWREVKREGMLPDRYEPIATDSHFDGSSRRRISSTWIGQDSRFPLTQALEPEETNETPSASYTAALQDIDNKILEHMRVRRIPYATFAIARDGRVMTAKSYSIVPENFLVDPRIRPDTPFHIASISKAVTALAVIRLVDAGALDLDMPITEIPGVNDLIGIEWSNVDMTQVTTRMLLYHLGGWDRDIDAEITLRRDYDICEADGLGLPVDMERMLDFAQDEPVAWGPGVKHTYSNFGFTLIGRVIEAVSGQSYVDFVKDLVLPPEVAARFEMAASTGPSPTDDPVEVIEGYDVRNPLVSSIWGTPSLASHPLRESCNPDHADRVLRTAGLYNTGLTDSHGGWIADAPATARLFSQIPSLMSQDAFETMVSRPTGREVRIYQENGFGTNIDHTYQLVRGRHPVGSPGIDLSSIPAGTRIFIGLGLNTFSSIDIELAAMATGDGVPVTASYTSAFNAVLPLEITDDGTNGLTQNGAISFVPPDDWQPQARNGETRPRFWIALQWGAIPGAAPVFHQVSLSGLVGRGLAFSTSPSVWTLDVTNFAPPAPTFELVGEESQASANVTTYTSGSGDSTLTITGKGQGSFIPGEVLGTVGPNDPAFAQVARVGAGRERPVSVNLEHGGSLPGVDTHARRRTDDGVSWALFFAQGASSTPFYIARGGGLLEDEIDGVMDTVPSTDWPGWDITSD